MGERVGKRVGEGRTERERVAISTADGRGDSLIEKEREKESARERRESTGARERE